MTAPVPVPDGTTPPAEAVEAAEAALDAHGSWGLHDTDDGFQCTGCHEVFASLTEWRSHRTRRIAAAVVAALRLPDRDRETAAKALDEFSAEVLADYEERTDRVGSYGQTKIRAALLTAGRMAAARASALREGRES